MKYFLPLIASEYSAHYPDISRLTFVMPNKRSGSFLLKAFSDCCDNAVIAPRIITISDFVSEISDLVADSRIDLLFRLYKVYRNLPETEELEFDKFRSWGEIILNDFNEIDMQMVDAEQVFKNVYDLNAIRSNFLSPEQKKVMKEYFGYSGPDVEHEFTRFWKNFDDNNSGIRHKFKALWQLLLPLYKGLKNELEAEGLTTTGGVYKCAASKIEEGFEPFKREKIIFVGFNALSESENRIFKALKKMRIQNLREEGETESKADFIWDMAPAIYAQDNGPAMKFVGVNVKKDNFPVPGWIEKALAETIPSTPPKLTVISVPSNVMQTKVAAQELSKMLVKETEEEKSGDALIQEKIKNAKVAIVLPEENLLSPLLFSLPPQFSKPNLTMGFPLRQTPVISFAGLLRRMHLRGKISGKSFTFFFEDVKDLLSHPYSKILFDQENITRFISYSEKERKLIVTEKNLQELGPRSDLVFRIFEEATPAEVIIDYIKEIVNSVKGNLEENRSQTFLRASVEKVYIGTYTDALIRLKNCLIRYNFPIKSKDVFSLADRLIGGESVVFDGRPLEGLQVMGVLETRCLDFEKIIMLSVNERVLPKVGRNSTFVPNIIRAAFGMPPANFQEEIFSYYFYRVLGRCREGILTYDSRSAENRSPGPSRYLLQLKYLCKKVELKEVEARFNLPKSLQNSLVVEKEDDIKLFLNQYVSGSVKEQFPESADKSEISTKLKEKYFSASSLNHYFRCPLQFLFADVLGIKVEREKLETIDAIDMGNIVHKVIEALYFPEGKRGKFLDEPIIITDKFLSSLLYEKNPGGETRIEKETRKYILKVHFGKTDKELENGRLSGSSVVISDFIINYVKNILRADLRITPFRLWGSEISQTLDYEIANPEGIPKSVRMKMVIDRLDQEGADGEDKPFRIIDYKTGNVHLEAEELPQLFESNLKGYNIFQLVFYAELLLLLVNDPHNEWGAKIKDKENFARNIQLLIYCVPQLLKEDGVKIPKIGVYIDEKGRVRPNEISSIQKLREEEDAEETEFMDLLNQKLLEILDTSIPFSAQPTESRCKFCDYKLRCDVMRAKIEDSVKNN